MEKHLIDNRNQLIEVFKDTLNLTIPEVIENQEFVKENSRIYQDTYVYGTDPSIYNGYKGNTKITITGEKSFEAAKRIVKETGNKTAVLNFADAITPGGLVWFGETTQEECLCRESTLYSAISSPKFKDQFYEFNLKHKKDRTGSDAIIYVPESLVFKSDDDIPILMDKKDWFNVDILTCAAPNNCMLDMDNDELYRIHYHRAIRILKCSYINGVKNLITGAFGCGAFYNDPNVVASAWKNAIKFVNTPGYRFENIIFAILCRDGIESINFKTFKEVFG